MSLGLPSACSSSARVDALRDFSTRSSLLRLQPIARPAASTHTSIPATTLGIARSSLDGVGPNWRGRVYQSAHLPRIGPEAGPPSPGGLRAQGTRRAGKIVTCSTPLCSLGEP